MLVQLNKENKKKEKERTDTSGEKKKNTITKKGKKFFEKEYSREARPQNPTADSEVKSNSVEAIYIDAKSCFG